ncbi:MAG: FIST N-terminal domain-containing protein [Actinomycetota bacterium]
MTDAPLPDGSMSGQPLPSFAVGLSQHPDPAVAAAEVVGQVGDRLDGVPTVAMLFASGAMANALGAVVDVIDTLMHPDVLVGTTAVGVVGSALEVEQGDGLALWAATGLPCTPVRLESLPANPPIVAGLPADIAEGSVVVALADPYSFAVDGLVEELNQRPGDIQLAGGLASAGPEQNRVILGSEVHLTGAVGLIFPPGTASTVVSQGCRPIGSPWVVTEAADQLAHALGGRPALERVNELIEGLSPEDRAAAARGLHAGLVANEQQQEFKPGDFLIRGVLGADRNSGAVAIGDRLEVGQVLQFQVRDEASASNELDRLLDPVSGRAGLLFTCNGRGSHMFSEPSHDAAKVSDTVGSAVAGMFCAGELGPIAGRNAVHGFTATVVVFP